jgi:hypothetical protein
MNFAAFAAGDNFHHLNRLVNAFHNSARFVKKDVASFRESDRFCAMLEKGNAEFIFEVANLPAQWGLRNVKPRGCARHVLLFSDRDEIA